MEMELTSVKSCYEESPPCQRVGFWRREEKKKITENHFFFNYETSGNQGAEEEGKEKERKGKRQKGRKKDT